MVVWDVRERGWGGLVWGGGRGSAGGVTVERGGEA